MPKRTAGAIIVRDNESTLEVLLTLRNVEPFGGQWCFPGGHIDPGESAEDTVVREVREEIGLVFKGTFFREFEECIREMGIDNVVSMFEGTVEGTLRIDPHEVVEARWFALPEAHALDLAFKHNEILRAWEEGQ